MPKQKQNNKQPYTLNKEPKIGRWWPVAIFFVVTMVISWAYVVFYCQATAAVSKYYWLGEARAVVTGGTSAATVEEEQENTYRLIDGEKVTPKTTAYIPYAVMIENLRSVRPQSGLSQASVVYESLVEGGATRFMAVFDPSAVIPEIMPVRSARPYYLEWISEYGGLYAHAGGSPKALTVIRENPDINNLEALSRDGVYFWRDTTRYAPHNLVTSSEKMNFALRDKELADKKATYNPWLFKDEASEESRGEDGKTVSFNFSYGLTYQVDYLYDRNQNSYLRSNAEEPHLDRNTGEQISVKNVIVQLVQEPVLDGGKGRLEIYVGGEGKAWIFRDGEVIEGTWKKESRTDRTRFYDAAGNEVELNRGNTWIHIVPEEQEVRYD